MTIFEQIANQNPYCEICGGEMIALYGGGWDNDRIYCKDDDCGAEYEFPTSTSVDEAD